MEALQRMHNRGSISTGLGNSCKFEEDNSESLWKTFSSEGTGTGKTFTISGWVKRTELGGIDIFMGVGRDVGGDANDGAIRFNSDQFQFVNFASNAYNVRTNAVFRDTSAWYHIMVAVDTTQGTDSNRVKLYVNGELQTSLTGTAYPTQNYQFKWGRAEEHVIGARPDSDATAGVAQVSQFWSGYMADVYFVDGLQLAPTDFGEYDEDSGIWKPKEYEGSYGTNGFYLDFSDAANLGDDASGNGNNFTENNITAADQATDTPTNNFCTLVGNQQFVPSKSTTLVREGGTIMHGGQNGGAYSTMGVRSGKWYFESTLLHLGGVGGENHGFGVIAADRLYEMNIDGEDIGADVGGWACAGNANPRNNNSGASGANYLTAPGINVVLGCALDMDNGKIWWHNAGTWHSLNSTVGNPATGASPAWSNLLTATDDFVLPVAGLYANGAGPERAMNFGGYALPAFTAVGTYSDANGYGSFAYAPPTGYYALCTKNLAEFG
jgi:hypothetical protein